jgi:hypothetical protein
MNATPEKLGEFGTKVSKYFLEFLETGFHRQQAPRRRIQLRNDANQTTGVPLRKYDALYRAAIGLLIRQISGTGARVLHVPRGKYKAPIDPILKNLISQHIDAIEPEKFKAIAEKVLGIASAGRPQAAVDHEKYIAEVVSAFEGAVATEIIHPLLALIDKPIRDSAYSAIESVFEIETDLVEALTQEAVAQLPEALNTFAIKGDEAPIQALLNEFLDESQARQHIKNFFESFATADAWQELRDLYSLTRIGENLQLYLYVCDLRFGNSLYPVVYIPLTVTQEDQSAEFHLELDSHLYANKRAVDFLAQELGVSQAKRALYGVDERIVYLEPGAAPAGQIDKILGRLHSLLDLDRVLSLDESGVQVARSSQVRMSTSAYFAIFDRSDEALLNDYKVLLHDLASNEPGVGALFQNIIRGFLLDEPADVRKEVDQRWDGLTVPERLVTETPIPLNEEQRKILDALDQPSVRYVIVQGPPGTGKSHTITAIAFECILKGHTLLVLSDKNEALDVVQEKLNEAMNRVRPNQSFQNPILRLGLTGGTYAKLLAPASVDSIREQHHAASSRRAEIEDGIRNARSTLTQNIAGTIEQLSGVNLAQIETLQRLEELIRKRAPEVVEALENGPCPNPKPQLDDALLWRKSAPGALRSLDTADAATVRDLVTHMKVCTLGTQLTMFAEHRSAFALFRTLKPGDAMILQNFVARYDDLRLPILGYLFRGRKLRALNAEVGHTLQVENFLDLHRRLNYLRTVCDLLPKAEVLAKAFGVTDVDFSLLYQHIVHGNQTYHDFSPMLRLLEAVDSALQQCGLKGMADWKIGEGERFENASAVAAFCFELANLMNLWNSLVAREAKVPVFDFVAERDQLEQLCAAKMVFEMDERLLNFCDESAALARTLRRVIRTRQKFPTEAFERLRDAFPCVIASIREFAEYIPLHQQMFDLVVIDEASQVSVAQAFPALLRAKKVVVFGDRRQFSNVKAAFASNEQNNAYVTDIKDYFRTNISDKADRLERVARFDVKRSVLDFFELIRNFEVMLRKHFRGYQELISFSSEHFYEGRLQAVKFRGKPIDEVIKFTVLDHDGRQEKYRNANSMEADFIIAQLETFLEMDEPPTVGIITPFREQVALLSKMVLAQPNARDYDEVLKLKIMTFDSCQGEEREIIFYSMVATDAHDALNYVFPVELKDAYEKVEDALKLQRLNVGFSRAQECIHFVLSKPIEQFSGSIRTALQHYRKILDDKSKAEPADTDPKSPMEKRLLGWLKATEFFQKYRKQIELRPQFPIGEYLRQLDPGYHHPKYRVDFLLVFKDGDKPISLVLEYDGFKDHFTNGMQVNQANWAFHYRPEDTERRMTLESYGYKFLRVNRFNLGRDPVVTLSARLSQLVDSARNETVDHAVVNRIRKDAEALSNGDKKFCRKCQKTKPLEAFFDKGLKGGTGGYGRYCLACKR